MLARFLRDHAGNTAVLFALALPAVGIAVGAAVDYSDLSREKAKLQAVADAAALAGARAMQDNGAQVPGQRQQTVKDTVAAVIHDKAPESTSQVQVSIKGYNGGTEDAVSVSVAYDKPLFFGGLLGASSASVVAGSAKAMPGSTQVFACVIALDTKSGKSFYVSGNGSVNVPNCGIYVDSTSNVALTQQGASWLKAKSVQVVGKVSGNNISPAPLTSQPSLADPLASLPEPTVPSGCTWSNTNFTTARTFAGGTVYCGSINFGADVTFGPGIHYFKGATVSITSNINMSGQGVMLYFDGSSSFSSSSTGSVSLTAMQSGTYQGIVMFGSRAAKTPTFKITGSKNYLVDGTIYLPSADLLLAGTADVTVTSYSGYVIAHQFTYQGDSSFNFDSYGGATPVALSPSAKLRLVQ